MCLKNKKECTLTTIKILGILLLTNLILTSMGIEYSLLYWIANFSYDSLPLIQGTELINSNVEKWGIRGQIGDIMSGHFSALAVLAVAYSITLQVEANKKMTESIKKQEEALNQTEASILQQKLSIEKQTEANLEQARNTLQQAKAIELQAKSIEQQNEALKIQAETLKGQIDELKASREESERQTEEFFIQNMNVKLDRYYRFFDEKIKLFDDTFMRRYKEQMALNTIINLIDKKEFYFKTSTNIYEILELIFKEIDSIKEKYPESYTMFIIEFKLRVSTDLILLDILEHYTSTEKYQVTSFLKQIIENKAEKPFINPAFRTL